MEVRFNTLLSNNDEKQGAELNIDARIKLATDKVKLSLKESLSSWLEDLKAQEKNIHQCSSQLADKPD